MENKLKSYMLYHKDLILPTEKFYVYVHKNPLTDKIFYVGSAQGNCMRAYEFNKHRNNQWKNEVRSFGGTCNLIIEIVKYCDNPIDAQKEEFKLIHELKKNGEAYCNGEGDISFKRKYQRLRYCLYENGKSLHFDRKTELYRYCAEKYDLSKKIVNAIIESEKEYNGMKVKAKGIKISKEGKEHM